jgi:hypothetical protein
MSTSREEIERKLAQTRRLTAETTDQQTLEQFRKLIHELELKLREMNQGVNP